MTTDPRIQVTYLPGGLSPATHAVHIVIAILTCGLWLPIYIILVGTAPLRRVQVSAPAEVPPAEVDAVRQRLATLTPEERRRANNRTLTALLIAAFPVLVLILVSVLGQLT